MTETNELFDYIVVGAGSSGCPVARGLSDDRNLRVLLLEAGPGDDKFWINTPAGMAKLYFHKTLNWNYRTEPMSLLQGRQMYWPRGKTLGGSSSINGMVFLRGHEKDYESWKSLGCPGWGYEDVLPYFKKMEHFERGPSEARGTGGPLWISDPVVKEQSSFDFIEAAEKCGIARNDDLNGISQEGVGFIQHNIRNGRRHSAYRAFISPVKGRPNLTVRTNCKVQRILFEGKKAVGLEVSDNGTLRRISCAREIILSGGSINTPQLLMLSGVGPKQELDRLGIPAVHVSPGVGENLQDHFYMHTGWRVTADSSYNSAISGLQKYWEGFKYLLTHKGYLALGSSQVAALIKSDPEVDYVDLQISFRPMSFRYNSNGTVEVEREPGIGVSVYKLRPKTTGKLTLRSKNPDEKPLLNPEFLTDAEDNLAVIRGIRKIRDIMAAAPMAKRVIAEAVPGPAYQSDEDLFRFMVETGNSAMHQGGTCKMGNDKMAVVDEKLRVRGIQGLRVVDASIMPHLTSGNTNAPSIMIGVKAVDLILKG